MKIAAAGYRLVWVANATAYHFESQTRVAVVADWERDLLTRPLDHPRRRPLPARRPGREPVGPERGVGGADAERGAEAGQLHRRMNRLGLRVSHQPLISYAQNGEDIVLWRALGHVREGVYVDVGGWEPDLDSVTRLFYDRGWRGVDVEPIPELAEKFRQRRPLNEVVQAVITDDSAERVVLHRFDATGLSTLDDELAERHDRDGREHEDILVAARRLDDVLAGSSLVVDTVHFLKIDVEGAEEKALRSIDLDRWRPWVVVVEATEPNSTTSSHASWEPILLAAGYTFTLFDGLSRFYVSARAS